MSMESCRPPPNEEDEDEVYTLEVVASIIIDCDDENDDEMSANATTTSCKNEEALPPSDSSNSSRSSRNRYTRHERLLAWLSLSSSSSGKLRRRPPETDESNQACCSRRHIDTSLDILNAIRDASRIYLEDNGKKKKTATTQQNSPQKNHHCCPKDNDDQIVQDYDKSFPSLAMSMQSKDVSQPRRGGRGSTTTTTTTRKPIPNLNPPPNRRKAKRRIRPAVVSSVTSVETNFAFLAGEGNNPVFVTEGSQEEADSSGGRQRQMSKPSSSCLLEKRLEANTTTTSITIHSQPPPPPSQDLPPIQTNIVIKTPTKTKPTATRPFALEAMTKNAISFSTPIKTNPAASPVVELEKWKQDNPLLTKRCERLMQVYVTLIESSLVPSTALELQLLFRLLSAREQHVQPSPDESMDNDDNFLTMTNNKGDGDDKPFARIFSSAASCVCFASQALSRLSYVLRGFGLVKSLTECAPFRQYCPRVTSQFESLLEEEERIDERSMTTLFELHKLAGGQTALFTIPFNQARDSRHNHRSREGQTLYNNREECRDSFLFQLRAFLHVRGKTVDGAQSARAVSQVQRSSRAVVDSLLDGNHPWFAEFFTDLLLQIGPIPIQETDQEILHLAQNDAEKLQKLHQRMSAKSTSTNKSSKKVRAEPKQDNAALSSSQTVSPVEAARVLFPGHQEFFFLFLVSLDSYKFVWHLRSRLISKAEEMAAEEPSMEEVERRVVHMQLIMRFLGVVVFWPNWGVGGKGFHGMHLSLSLDGINQLTATGLSLMESVEEACVHGRLITVIPWVVEVLKMSTWDETAWQSASYRRMLGLLRSLQVSLLGNERASLTTGCMSLASRQLVTSCLQTLFDDVVGLARIPSLPSVDIPKMNFVNGDGEPKNLDLSMTGFSSTMWSNCSTYVEELETLISNLSRQQSPNASRRSPGVSRKLRPTTVMQAVQGGAAPEEPEADAPNAPLSTAPNQSSRYTVRLRDTFFHQHQGLRDVCEFVVHRMLKIAFTALPRECIIPVLDQAVDRCPLSNTEKSKLRIDAIKSCQAFLRNSLETSLRKALDLLGPPGTDDRVKEVCKTIGVQQGMELGATMVATLVGAEMKTFEESQLRKMRKLSLQQSSPAIDMNAHFDAAHGHLLVALADMDMLMTALTAEEGENFSTALRKLLSSLDAWFDAKKGPHPPERELRALFEGVLKLDEHSLSLLTARGCSGVDDKPKDWPTLFSYLQLATHVSRFSRHGFVRVKMFLSETSHLCNTIRLGLAEDHWDQVAQIVVELVRARIVSVNTLQDALGVLATQDSPTTLDNFVKTILSVAKRDHCMSASFQRLEDWHRPNGAETSK